MPIPSFHEDNLRSLCDVLGDTNSGLTHDEIDILLKQTNIFDPQSTLPKSPDFYYPITKRKRLFQALSLRQKEDHCGNNVLHFVKTALNPIRYVNTPDKFEVLLNGVNRVLLFSGFSLREDGEISRASKVKTISESERRANNLRQRLIERDAHPDVLRFCRAELLTDNYFHAVLEATKSVADKIRQKSGNNRDGAVLVDEVFALRKNRVPILAFNSLCTETERSEHTGIMNLLKGMFGTFRNVTAHAPKVSWPMSVDDALDLLSMASFLHRRIDNSKTL